MQLQRMNMSCIVFVLLCLSIDVLIAVEIKIDTSRILHEVDERFTSVAIDSGVIRRHWDKGKFNPRSVKVNTLATALAPSYLRIGGTDADFLIFDDGSADSAGDATYWSRYREYPEVKLRSRRDVGLYEGELPTNFTMSAEMFDQINNFSSSVGWDLLFDVNLLLRRNGHWEPDNALKLMKYTAERGYKMAGWELGNEPDDLLLSYNITIDPRVLAEDYVKFHDVVRNFTEFKNSRILGPSVCQVSDLFKIDYYNRFFEAGGGQAITSASFHQYYIDGRTATIGQFMDPAVMNVLRDEVDIGVSIAHGLAPQADVWLGETSSAWGGGAKGLSDRYVAGFLWLDKLGIAARGGIDVAIRQSFYGGHYALLDMETSDPTPDFWLTLLYKRLVGRRVLNVITPENTGLLRVYAHCVNTDSLDYRPGGVVVYILNLNNSIVDVTFPDIRPTEERVDLYMLIPENYNLTSQTVTLNGLQVLEMVDDRTMPQMLPMKTSLPLFVPPHSFGFFVFPNADVNVCKT